MPNWCECELWVHGPKTQRESFCDAVTSPESECYSLDFNQIIPYPADLAEADRRSAEHRAAGGVWSEVPDGYNHGGHEWCCTNWGTKWNACDCELVRTKTSLHYSFETAWSPPIPVIRAMAQRFPELTFTIRFYECGMAFQGCLKLKGTTVLKDERKEYYGHRGG